MKKRLQGLIVGILFGIMMVGVPVLAKTGSNYIEVIYDNIKLYVDGVKIEPRDSNGSIVEPFIYNGTTYLPVRAIGEAIGKTVTWDGTTKSVYIGEQWGYGQYLMEVCPPYEKDSIYTDSFYMAGKKYSNGFYARRYNYGKAYFNLNGKYEELTCIIGHVDGWSDYEKVVYFYVDGKLVKEVEIMEGAMPKEVVVPLNYGLQLKILTDVKRGTPEVGIADIKVY